MNYQEFSSKIKQKYPEYRDMEDLDLAQRMVKKYPQYSDVTFDEPKTDYRQVIGQSMKDIFQKPAALAKDVGTNPQTMANMMPGLLGTAGGISPMPGGATMGTAAGQGIRDLSLMGLKKPVPGMMQHGLELGGAALGDVAAIPAIKKAYFGGKIGQAEKAAGVMTRPPLKAVTPGSVGETLNNLEAQIDAGVINTPQAARDAKAVISQVYKNPKIYEQTPEIAVTAQRVSQKVQNLLNASVPGRAAPAAAMGKAMTIPNVIGKGYKAVPWQAKLGILGGGADALIRKLLGVR